MEEARDPAIKLFGRTIAVPEAEGRSDPVVVVETDHEKDSCRETTREINEGTIKGLMEELTEVESPSPLKEEIEVEQKERPEDRKTTDSKPEEEHIEIDDDVDQEKLLKKPTKVLPCPRCNSLDTKFCYYNNYNVNQPRHFCKNCQRYWTAGGSMRNVPVGAGRRKNKHSASLCHHIVLSSDAVSSSRAENLDSGHHKVLSCEIPTVGPPLQGNGTVLKFGPDVPLSESMATALNIGNQNRNTEFCETVEEPSCGSSVSTPNTIIENDVPENASRVERRIPAAKDNGTPFPPVHHLPCFTAPSWPYPWNPAWNNIVPVTAGRCSSELENRNSNQPVQWSSPPMVAAPAFYPPNIPFPFVPASYWGCLPGWAPGVWNVPWLSLNGVPPSPTSSNCNSVCSGNGSRNLGKHSRDANSQAEEKTEKSLWFPKTLRIDDPDEAAKSSIWATLGIKHDEKESTAKGGIFKAFQPKTNGKIQSSGAEQVLLSNPAALSRSQTFQEST